MNVVAVTLSTSGRVVVALRPSEQEAALPFAAGLRE